MVKNDNVIIIDEFTGRAMEGRRFGEGQHQAIEAKENVSVQPENQTLASVTFQNYFRMYPKLAGMTGTALTEEGEFSEIINEYNQFTRSKSGTGSLAIDSISLFNNYCEKSKNTFNNNWLGTISKGAESNCIHIK